MADKKVAVIMSTYNGESFIREQLESILEQTYRNVEIEYSRWFEYSDVLKASRLFTGEM